MSKNVTRVSSEKPLQGAVLCCTSVTPEDRSRLADYAQQMGAEHKLDLTSDVTHLIVGSTDTPKYAYVAREREDVKVLRPEWVQAVRQVWMEDQKLDMNALEAEYRVPTFAGLRICITGFDDLTFRSKLADNVKQHGGEYCGDLTKDVTHLVAAAPEGKKYEYATSWGKKIVSLKWYRDTLERGMQLNEESYHPAIPAENQGLGAWNRQQPTTGKRLRVDEPSQEPIRKLRRAASAKYGGQTDNMWGDIVGPANTDQPVTRNQDLLRPSRSMSAMQYQGLAQPDKLSARTPRDVEPTNTNATKDRDKYLVGNHFTVQGFDGKRKQILQDVLQRAGAQVYDTLADLITEALVESSNSFIIVPHTTKQSALPYLGRSSIKPCLVSELWLEQCMACKQFVSVQDYPIGGIIEEITHPEIGHFTINATGFESIMTLHISKVVRLTGAEYTETFSNKCSVLVVNSRPHHNNSNHKRDAARQWNIPVVSEKWLWKFVKTGTIPPFETQHEQTPDDEDNDLQRQLGQKRQEQLARQQREATNIQPSDTIRDRINCDRVDSITRDSIPKQKHATNSGSASAADVAVRRSWSEQRTDPSSLPPPASAKTVEAMQGPVDGPLHEMSPNSPTKRVQDHVYTKPPVPSYDGASSAKENPLESIARLAPDVDGGNGKSRSPAKLRRDASAMNSAIQDLLNANAKSKIPATKTDPDDVSMGKKRRLLGRALSNLSNSSRTSNPRQSRASSIDSINTDGIGSELLMPSGHSKATPDDGAEAGLQRVSSFTLTGRANRRTLSIPAPPTIDISDPNLCRDEFADDHSPQLTQLGYEDSEEAIALREKLAEKRRTRSRLGQQEGDPLPLIRDKVLDEVKSKTKKTEKRIIMDDEAMLALEDQAGWGGGRRTRLRDKMRNADADDTMF